MGLAATATAGGWPDDVWAPSAIAHNDKFAVPKELTKEGIKNIVAAFVAAAKRALKVGFGAYHQSQPYFLHLFNLYTISMAQMSSRSTMPMDTCFTSS